MPAVERLNTFPNWLLFFSKAVYLQKGPLIFPSFDYFSLCLKNSLEFLTKTDQFLNFIKISDFSDNEYEMYTWENLNRQYSWYLRRASSTSKKFPTQKFLEVSLLKIKRKSKFSCQKFRFVTCQDFRHFWGLWNCQIWVYVSFYDIICCFVCLRICHFNVIFDIFSRLFLGQTWNALNLPSGHVSWLWLDVSSEGFTLGGI